MEFNCPACSTPHAFPDDQIPDGGIVVACTRCAAHVTLSRAGVVAPAGGRKSMPPGAPAPDEAPIEATSQAMASLRPSRIMEAPPEEPPPAAEPPPSVAEPPPRAAEPPPSAAEPPPEKKEGFLGKAGRGLSAAAARAKEAAEAGKRAFDDAADDEMGAPAAPPGLAIPGAAAATDAHWTWRDLPRAFLGVFDLRRVLFATAGFWAAINVFALLQWLGGWLGAKVAGVIATVFSVVAWVGFVGIVALVASVMGYVCHQVVVEGRASSVKAGIDWTKAHLKSVLGTPLAFVAVIAAIAVAEGVVGAVGRIPWAGPIVWGVASPALFAASLVAGVVAVAMVYSLPLYIPVIYNEKTGPKQTLQRLLGLFREHGFSLVGLLLVALLMITVVYAVTVVPAFETSRMLTSQVGASAMGANLPGLFGSAPGAYPAFLAFAMDPLPLLGAAGGLGETNFGHTLGGLLAGLLGASAFFALLIALFALAWYTAGCIIYAIVTKRAKPRP